MKEFVLSLSAMLSGVTGDFVQDESDFEVTIENGGVTVTGYTGSSKTAAIPARIGGLPVTSIGDEAFSDNRLTGVSIPGSVTSIRDRAFAENQLTSVTIPNRKTVIEEGAFDEKAKIIWGGEF
jgi:hypothetical protein